jgi:hypothetical protein
VARRLDEQIDHLYQVPLDEFTAARNALAKESGAEGKEIKQLPKPPLAAWAVNQLYWHRANEYGSLIDAAEQMRKAHKSVIEGRSGDLRFAGREHELAVEKALQATLEILKDRGHPVTEASRQAILNTLRALPADEPPGRLSRALTPGGFEMLAGITPARGPQVRGSAGPKVQESAGSRVRGAAGAKGQGSGSRDVRAQELETQRIREAAERTVREAEHRARRAEFETARAVREATKAEKRLADAREALDRAKEEAATAEREAAAALRARDAAERKSRDAESALEAARDRGK